MDKHVYVSLPGFRHNLELNLIIIDLWKEHPEYFYDGVVIDSVYDCFPCKWTGGRGIGSWEYALKNYDEMNTYLTPILERGVKIRYNFTNSLVTKEHIHDEHSNEILKRTLEIIKPYNLPLGITVASDALKEYLEKNFDNIYLLWSTTLGQIGLDEINKKTKDNILVLDYVYNNDFKFLTQLQYPEHIEILANEHCQINCPFRKIHWRWISEVMLHYPETSTPPTACMNQKTMKVLEARDDPSISSKTVNAYQLQQMYAPFGINKLKLAGRAEFHTGLLPDYVKTLIKPYYQQQVLRQLEDKVGYKYAGTSSEDLYFEENAMRLYGKHWDDIKN